MNFVGDGEVLITRGFIVDTIVTGGQPFYVDGPRPDIVPALRAFLNWLTLFVDNISIGELDIFQRTLCDGTWKYSVSGQSSSQRLAPFFELIQKLLPGLWKEDPAIQAPFEDTRLAPDVLEARRYAIVASVALRMHAKRHVISKTKLVGLASQTTQEGDKIAVLFGRDFPVVMRNLGSFWMMVGETYVEGIMYGEAMTGLQSGQYKEEAFTIR